MKKKLEDVIVRLDLRLSVLNLNDLNSARLLAYINTKTELIRHQKVHATPMVEEKFSFRKPHCIKTCYSEVLLYVILVIELHPI